MRVYLVVARDPLIGGVIVSPHATEESATEEAARLAAQVREDWIVRRSQDFEFGWHDKNKPRIPQPSPQTYDAVIEEMIRWDVSHGVDLTAGNDYGIKIEVKELKGMSS